MKYLFILLALSILPFANADKGKIPEGEYTKPKLIDNQPEMGYLQAKGTFTVRRSDIRVISVEHGGVAYNGGLQAGDAIIAANGKKFDEMNDNVNDGGKGPREGLGYAMDESLRHKNGSLVLTVLRGGKTINLKLKLPEMPGLEENYPYFCARSEIMITKMANWLVSKRRPDGLWGHHVANATAALGLLATGEAQYRQVVREVAHSYIDKDLRGGGLPMWGYVYIGSFLAEYYLASTDQAVLPKLKEIVDTMALEATSTTGKHAHGISTTPGYEHVVKDAGINIISTHVYLTWTLAQKCGLTVPETQYNAVLGWLRRATSPGGGTGYIGAYGHGDGAGRTGLFTCGLNISNDDPELLAVQLGYLERHTKRMREAHANGLFGMIWGTAALAAGNPGGYRRHMDYWRWYIELGDAHSSSTQSRWYIGSRGNNGGDSYLGMDLYNHAAILMMLTSARKKLFVHGNKKINWFSASEQNLIDFYKKTYKTPKTLYAYLTKKINEISTLAQLPDTLSFIHKELKGKNKKRAKKLYKLIRNDIKKKNEKLDQLAIIQPGHSFDILCRLRTAITSDAQLDKDLERAMIALVSRREVRLLRRYRMDYQKTLELKIDEKPYKKRARKLKKRLLLVCKIFPSPETRAEAVLLIEKINKL